MSSLLQELSSIQPPSQEQERAEQENQGYGVGAQGIQGQAGGCCEGVHTSSVEL